MSIEEKSSLLADLKSALVEGEGELSDEDCRLVSEALERMANRDRAEGSAIESCVWSEVKKTVKEKGLRGVLYSDEEGENATLQYSVGDGERRRVAMRVSYNRNAHAISFNASYPFYVDKRVMFTARAMSCRECYSKRWTRLELDDRDGEVSVSAVLWQVDDEPLRPEFSLFLSLVQSVAFDYYDDLERLSRGVLSDKEREAFVKELELIAPLFGE